MKIRTGLAILVLVVPILAFSQMTQGQPTFGIYLTRLSEQAIQALETSPIPLESVELDPAPLIGQSDIVEYDFSTHVMKLTPEAFDRVSRIRVASVSSGIPFVVVAGGRKHYMGLFWSSSSSIPTSYPYINSPPLPASADDGCVKYCIQIQPPSRDVRATPYMALRKLELLKKGQ